MQVLALYCKHCDWNKFMKLNVTERVWELMIFEIIIRLAYDK